MNEESGHDRPCEPGGNYGLCKRHPTCEMIQRRLQDAERLIRELLYGGLPGSPFVADVHVHPATVIVRCAITRGEYDELVKKYPRETKT